MKTLTKGSIVHGRETREYGPCTCQVAGSVECSEHRPASLAWLGWPKDGNQLHVLMGDHFESSGIWQTFLCSDGLVAGVCLREDLN